MNLFSRPFQRASGRPQTRRTPAPKPASRCRPRLECLEGRDVPSTLLVTNPVDNVTNITPGTLRYEVDHAQPGDTITFAPNLFAPNTVHAIHLSAQLTISRSLTIQGPGADQLAISGQGQSGLCRVLEVNRALSVTITGLTIENGGGNGNSGNPYAGQGTGILNLGTLTLSDCTVTQNQSTLGGGVANYGTLTVNHCILSHNTANAGGGIYNGNGATATVGNSTFISNTSYGGAIYNSTNVHFTDGGGNTFA
jgi:hypothetical protein